jgi:hypothetical protein
VAIDRGPSLTEIKVEAIGDFKIGDEASGRCEACTRGGGRGPLAV